MIALMNFNTYLGGGETLMVRLADYFQSKGMEFILFYKLGSYIESDLRKKCIKEEHCCPIDLPADYYYLDDTRRRLLRSTILSKLDRSNKYELFSFCSRDLYLSIDLSKSPVYTIKIVHLILHEQDNLYCCQTIFDKLKLKFTGRRTISSDKMIEFNAQLYNEVNNHGVLIPMSDIIVELWGGRYGINMDYSQVVPLPTCSFPDYNFDPVNNKKILWIGRIVDFKIPALCAMLNFLKRRSDYSLSIIGYGTDGYIQDYMLKHEINKEQIDFLGKVDYDQLGTIIKKHAIGYAMGTSIIEMAQYGIPVIMALANPLFKHFQKDICGGLYVNKRNGNVGGDLYVDDDENHYETIDKSIAQIEQNYLASAKDSYECVRKMFDFQSNADAYVSSSMNRGDYYKYRISIPSANFVRKVIFNFIKN